MNEEYLTWEEKVLDQLERWVKYDKPITRKQAEETIDFICEQDNVIDRIGKQRDKQKEVLDKIKEKIKTYPNISYASAEKVDGKRLSGQLIPVTEILELLEEIK